MTTATELFRKSLDGLLGFVYMVFLRPRDMPLLNRIYFFSDKTARDAYSFAKKLRRVADFLAGYRTYLGAWKTLAPHCEFEVYVTECFAYAFKIAALKKRMLRELGDHTDVIDFDSHAVVEGYDYYVSACGLNRPLMLVSWHHGAHVLGDKALVCVIPEVIRFGTRDETTNGNQIVRFSVDGFKQGMQLYKALISKKPVFTYLDGSWGTERCFLMLLGQKVYLPSTFIRVSKLAKALIVPVSFGITDDEKLKIKFMPVFDISNLKEQSGEAILQALVDRFVATMKTDSSQSLNVRAFSWLRNKAVIKSNDLKRSENGYRR